MKWTRKKLIKSYLEFFKSKDHKILPSSSLVPENDPTVLFTTAGMHPLVPYLLGQKHPLGKRFVNVQKCIRTTDIEEVGDETHHTFFEMLGNWSFGDYWKKDAIKYTFEFHTKILGIPLSHYAISVFEGDKDASQDKESAEIWESIGVPKERIAFLSKKENWWGPAGETGPCGPDTEQFYWIGKENPPKKFVPEDKRWIEIGNDVLMQYIKNKSGNFKEAKQKNVDFGGGVERTVAVLNGLKDNYLADMWKPIIEKIEHLSGKTYEKNKRTMRVIADHTKAAVFIIADGVKPSNTGRGYVLRRLIRRAIVNLRKLGFVGTDLINPIAEPIFELYDDYGELEGNKKKILKEIEKEENKFEKTLDKGMKIFDKVVKGKTLSGKDAFLLYQSYGFPIELTREIAKDREIDLDEGSFEKELQKHKDLSKTASKGKFASGLADHSEKTTRLHTATHLLNESLRQVLNKNIKQKGSNITPERLRFDFDFPRKLTKEEIKKIEDLVNKKIGEGLKVTSKEMSLEKALESGAQSEFGAKYPKRVSVYSIGDFSKEICTGPHVKNTKEIGKFNITKEQSSAAGIRRIKAIVEKSNKKD
ncbi:MAG: alanine--tRNA ligase [Candidatus Pacearchaeota archaeon]